ncbi:hypothetical protein CSA80_03725 [Candidatus Saccharibacteria bacterium]|nr:MAG: hypothetical protein CR973_01215 [Candidatus Saccharibacteria bacterium]PID99195.1 MAG: hypothetical protein CSA80_03725 [Candidatus Saccharibacteria bacterium]
MKQRFLQLTAAFVFVLGFAGLAVLMPAQQAYAANSKDAACEAITGKSDCSGSTGSADVNKTVKLAINIFSTVIGIVAVIMIVVAGYRYITAAGESSKVATAKNTLMYALVGLLLVALAQFIVSFVLNKATSTQCPSGQVRNSAGQCVAAPTP